jgi:predicted GNAT superfamily acetyltransferase
VALAAPDAEAFLIAFDQDGDYDSPNFLWFRERFARFLYIDRVVVAAAAQGQGWGRKLYAKLIETAKASGHDRIVAEINIQPPNPVSLAFHERLGFAAVGERALSLDKVVRYVALEV